MSQADSILGIPDLAVQQVQRAKYIHVWAHPKHRPGCLYCQAQTVRIKATHRRTLKHTRQGNQLMLLHLTVPKYHCMQCNRYFRHRFTGITPRRRATEIFRLEVFEAHEGGVSQRKGSPSKKGAVKKKRHSMPKHGVYTKERGTGTNSDS